MILAAFFFSLMQLCVKFLKHLPTTELVFFRSIVSLVASLIHLRIVGVHPLGNNKKFLILRGVFGATALSLFFYTLQSLPISTASIIQYTSPIFTAFFAIFILKEPMKPKQWLYFAIAFGGIAFIKGFDNRVEAQFLIAGIVSAVFSGLAYNCIRMLKDTDHPVVVVLYFPLVAAPVMGILSVFNWVTPTGWDWALLLLMGLLTQIAQINMTKAYQTAQANKVASLKYIGVGFGLAIDFFIFQYTFEWGALLGMLLVLIGIVLNVTSK